LKNNKDYRTSKQYQQLIKCFNELKIEGNKSLLPIPEDAAFAAFAFIDSDMEPAFVFYKMLAQAVSNDCSLGFIDEDVTDEDLLAFKKSIEDCSITLCAFFLQENFDLDLKYPFAVKAFGMLTEGKPSIAIIFENNELTESIISDVKIHTDDWSDSNMAAVVMALSGRELDNFENKN